MDTLPNIVANKHMKRYPTSFVKEQIQIKMTIQYQHTPVSGLKTILIDNSNV